MKNNIVTGVVLTLTAVVSLGVVFIVGAPFVQAAYEPQHIADVSVNTNTDFRPSVESRIIATNTIGYVEKPVTEIRYIDRVEKVPVQLRNFNSLEELSQWLKGVNTDTTVVYFEGPEAKIDCDDFALGLQQKALADGYLMSFQIIEPVTYNSLFQNSKLPLSTHHAVDLTIIGNNVYYIEPQTGEVVLVAELD
jgi:hypothetical protein